MMNNRNLANYTKVQVTSKTRLLIMLYDGAIKFLHMANRNIDEGNMPSKRTYIAKSVAIISELNRALNMDTGGSVAEDLELLYVYMQKCLSKANLENSTAGVNEVITLLSDIKNTWEEAIKIAAKENYSAATPAQQFAPAPTSAGARVALNVSV